MEIVHKKQSRAHDADGAMVYEYDMRDAGLGGATAEIAGRHPHKGWVINQASKQLAFVMVGTGRLVTPSGARELTAGDMVLCDQGEKFAWEGNMTLFLANAPRFDPAQCVVVD
jgi:hypothetical protein